MPNKITHQSSRSTLLDNILPLQINKVSKRKKLHNCKRTSNQYRHVYIRSCRGQKPITSVSDQYIALPLALCGLPLKGQKSFAKRHLKPGMKRQPPTVLPPSWVPEYCIIEGMFMLNINPISHRTFSDKQIHCTTVVQGDKGSTCNF